MSFVLYGYLTPADDTHFTLVGDHKHALDVLNANYWEPGVCRHVSRDKRECTIKTQLVTQYIKGGASCITFKDLDGCFVKAHVSIRKYKYCVNGKSIKGWTIIASRIEQTSPLNPA